MSEYWKSTPKYWCKHCKVFVRDTKLEKTNHEATPRHQGNLKRFVRDIHRGHEKEEKDKERAKSEVARLNGLVAGGGSGASSSGSGFGRGPTPSVPKPQASAAQRKQQLAQLAELGVSIPDEFRPDMAMAGEWQVTSERVLEPDSETKVEAKAMGVKRERGEEEDDPEAAELKKKRWGSKFRAHPTEEDNADLDTLLIQATARSREPAIKPEVKTEDEKLEHIKSEIKVEPTPTACLLESGAANSSTEGVKEEEVPNILADIPDSDVTPKQEGVGQSATGIVFKKRKAKNIRQK
ncbi:C2H2 and C2HC zinc finger [Glarea lozoyensis ATCC 20868]|uniref:C2H2 and C2HC zinc finger n=2 Tax=Glarea lozoyensis TaxID=101852 RepID=S3CTI7_GLAL2|nr:C2H2 and C2HC zinc finger [Glarea lozoyensis ATCC 20868]EHL03136.1 hypothetical protein M7I_0749 [Glarea lozoyensis 74030]EPE28975.1 C2H2 and C2HC zinc finger [Glarea lozoyensis ATCC 20868]